MAVIDPPSVLDAHELDDRSSDDAPVGGTDNGPETRPFRALELLPITLIGIVAPILLFGMVPFGSPVVYSQDAFQHLAIARSANWLGTPGRSALLDAPYGVDWHASVPTGTERLHVLVLKAFWTVTGGDPHLTLNLDVVLGVAATVVVSYLVLRWMRIGPLLAGAAAVVFAFGAVLTDRLSSGHLFLFPLYPVALGVYLAMLGTSWRSGRGWRGLLLPGVAVVVVATSSVYYATFTVILVVALGVVAAIRAGRWRSLLAPAVIVVAMAAAIATTLAPDVLARADASTAGGFARPVQDSDRYGLRIAQMVLPLPTTRIPGLGGIAERSYWIESVGDYGASIGPLAVVGLVAIGWSTLRRIGRPRDQVDRTVARLAAIAATSVLVAAAGAGGLLLAAAGFTQTRVWSRMAAFVGFAALAGLALLVQRRVGRRRLLWPWVVAIAMLALVEHPLVPPTAPIRTAVREDAALVHSLEDALPSGAEVLSLPVVPFPDDLGSERLLAPSLLSDDLRFSAGEFKGGPGDWQQSWFTGDLADDTFLAAVAGFDALVLQRSHTLVDDPALADADMANAAGQPVWTSDDGTWSWVDLRPLRARLDQRAGTAAVRDAGAAVTRPIGITLGDRRLLTWTHDEVVQHLGPDASIDLHRLDDDPGPAELSLDIGAADGATVEVDAPGADTVRVRPGVDGERVTITVPTLDDVTTVRIRSDGPETRFDGGTPASVWVADVRARDSRGIELVDALR